jgi:hypothetical protein
MLDRADVRRLAAVDMHGLTGDPRRARFIRVEFSVGVVGCIGLGIFTLLTGSGAGILIGIWLIGIGFNYVPLAANARDLSRPGKLEEELRGLDIRAEAGRAGRRQLWILIPVALVVSSLR